MWCWSWPHFTYLSAIWKTDCTSSAGYSVTVKNKATQLRNPVCRWKFTFKKVCTEAPDGFIESQELCEGMATELTVMSLSRCDPGSQLSSIAQEWWKEPLNISVCEQACNTPGTRCTQVQETAGYWLMQPTLASLTDSSAATYVIVEQEQS